MFSKSVNKVILVGRLGNDPDSKSTPSGATVVNFSMATERSWKDRDGNRQKETSWHRVVVWRGLADLVKEYAKKGNMIYVEGYLQTRSWEDQNGQKRYVTEVVANEIQLLESGQQQRSAGGGSFDPPMPSDEPQSSEAMDDDVPF